MKMRFFLFLTIIIFCIGCKKADMGKFGAENADPMPPVSFSGDDVAAGQPEQSFQTTIQDETDTITDTLQEIIRNYPATLPDNYFYPIEYVFQIEGNFTGSGNREIFAFYQEIRDLGYYVTEPSLNFFYCFVFDTSGKEIVNIYQLKWSTSLLKDKSYVGLTEALGRPIICKDLIVGYASDFNGNGKDELYMYSITGVGYWPSIFEFDGKEFVDLLSLTPGPKEVVITNIDPEKKILTLKIQKNIESLEYQLLEETNSYIWDNVNQRYEILSSEVKYYRWERTLRQFIEIEI